MIQLLPAAAALSQPHLHNALLLPPNAFTVSVHAPLALTIVSPRIIFASMRPTVFTFNLGGKGSNKGALLCALCGSGHFLTAPLHAASPTSASCSLQAAPLLYSLQLKSSDALWLAVGTAAVNGTGQCEARGQVARAPQYFSLQMNRGLRPFHPCNCKLCQRVVVRGAAVPAPPLFLPC